MLNCKKCGRANEAHYRFCLGCGARLQEPKADPPASSPERPAASAAPSAPPKPRPCVQCGYEVPPDHLFCGRCGAKNDPPKPPAPKTEIILIRADGSEGQRLPLAEGELVLGRDHEALATDAYISPRHARFALRQGQATVEDLGSLNGTFVRLTKPTRLQHGAQLRVGLELLEFQEPGSEDPHAETRVLGSPVGERPWGRLARILGPHREADAYLLHSAEVSIGRDRGDILFSQDAFVSGNHVRLRQGMEGPVIEDLGSSNGTYLRLSAQWPLQHGDMLLLGQQILRFHQK